MFAMEAHGGVVACNRKGDVLFYVCAKVAQEVYPFTEEL